MAGHGLTQVTSNAWSTTSKFPPTSRPWSSSSSVWSRKNTIRIVADGLRRDSARGREGGRRELQGAGTGRAVGRHRRAAARLLAAAEPSPDLRRPAAGARRRPTPNRLEVVSQQPLVDAERILRDFTRRAFRRAVTDEDIKPFLARVKAKLDAEVLVRAGDARRPQGRAGLAALSCSCARSPASSTTSPWPAGCPISCGVRCPTRNCSRSPSRAS